MNIRTFLLLLVLAAVAAFVALNWSTFLAPSTLSLGFASFEAPLGLVMLGLLAALALAFLGFIVFLQTSVLLEARRHARELQTQRDLADQAEASRFTELRGFIEGEMRALAARDTDATHALLARIDQLETGLRGALSDSSNTLAAYLGELDDRLAREGRVAIAPATPRRDH
ncbi:LapA family protein [Noviherbaspirillum aridicola]|uniref:Signal transduction histidine kinase n=1 Tax=Noviherbaspirillum aridicola TaxID=2849687 RepID=A0ABQ4PZG9_9BURK|nr:LapA family protein [Noviherbaspirillum aridicola]GIZ50218.1 hypothetical protein NCCP691_02320 [Noviherbaspirillum aridicola]